MLCHYPELPARSFVLRKTKDKGIYHLIKQTYSFIGLPYQIAKHPV